MQFLGSIEFKTSLHSRQYQILDIITLRWNQVLNCIRFQSG